MKPITDDGTTDNDNASLTERPQITDAEIQYLCGVASDYCAIRSRIGLALSGVRPLFDDGADEATEATRDYVITQDRATGGKLINIFGGKITTYRKLAEEVDLGGLNVMKKKTKKWTAHAALPGGDFRNGSLINCSPRPPPTFLC